MKEPERWLVAAWPGQGHVATTAAVYLLSKLRMHQVAEFTARGLFELESVDVKHGVVRAARLPRSRFFLWRNPHGGRDIVVFLGEAQPPMGKLPLCERILTEGRALGVTRVLSFSSIATEMSPGSPSKAYGIASDGGLLKELSAHKIEVLPEGRIAGLNGVILSAAAESGLPAVGLLGEMPAMAPQLPYPNASAALLRVFAELAGIPLDMTELDEYGRAMQQQLKELYEQVTRVLGVETASAPQPPAPPRQEKPPPDDELSPEDAARIETMFAQARGDRSKAFELKATLDRLGVFRDYEDRFLDLFEPHP